MKVSSKLLARRAKVQKRYLAGLADREAWKARMEALNHGSLKFKENLGE